MFTAIKYIKKYTVYILLLFVIVSSDQRITYAVIQSNNPIILSVAPLFPMPDVFNDQLFEEFEISHPQVEVVVVDNPFFISDPTGDARGYLSQMLQYATLADVISVGPTLTPIATRGGILLDLKPLIEADANFDASIYAPQAWESFQWDNSIWALPASTSLTILGFNSSKFDTEKVSYPVSTWDFDNFSSIVRMLAEYDENGDVVAPGLAYGFTSPARIITSLLDEPLINADGVPEFNSPELQMIINKWNELVAEGVITEMPKSNTLDDVPMIIERNFNINSSSIYKYIALPGSKVWIDTTGFAVSRGTKNPELAYELALYLAKNELVNLSYGSSPAILSTFTQLAAVNNPDFVKTSEDFLELVVPVEQRLYSSYLHLPIVRSTPETVEELLLNAETQLALDLNIAKEFSETLQINIIEPTLPAYMPDAVMLKFGIHTDNFSTFDNEMLGLLSQQFIEDSPSVQGVQIDVSTSSIDKFPEQYDCFYSNENMISDIDTSTILDLKPLMESDPDFASEDVVTNVLEQLSYEGAVLAYPMNIRPLILRYDNSLLERLQAPLPEMGWQVQKFSDTLQLIWQSTGANTPVLKPMFSTDNRYLLLLIAAYGGMPFDFSSTPPQVNLTSEETIEAVKAVLDLARNGIIDYLPLGPTRTRSVLYDAPPFFADALELSLPVNYSSYNIIDFPSGSKYTPLSYSIATAYISKDSIHPEVCYEWIKYLSQRPDLFNGFPANTSLPDIEVLANVVGQNGIKFFNTYIQKLQDPNMVVIPETYDFYEQMWLNQAFDLYVLENADLRDVLMEANEKIESYRQCKANDLRVSPQCGDAIGF